MASTTYGATHIVIDDTQGSKKFSGLELEERIHSILIPACRIAGCTFEFGKSRGLRPGHHMSAVLRAYRKMGFIKKLVSKTKGNDEYTVTLRNYPRHSYRNSTHDWRSFAKDIGARVIEDYYDFPISLEDRFSLYAGAKMNYFVANGPMTLCQFSDYPYTAYINPTGVWETYHKDHGWYKTQLPWANKNQKIVWEPWKATSHTS